MKVRKIMLTAIYCVHLLPIALVYAGFIQKVCNQIQEYSRTFAGKIGLFQEHFQEHFMYNKKSKHVRYKQQFIERKQKNNGCCPQNYWSHCVSSKSQQTLHTSFSVASLLSSSFYTTCHYNYICLCWITLILSMINQDSQAYLCFINIAF